MPSKPLPSTIYRVWKCYKDHEMNNESPPLKARVFQKIGISWSLLDHDTSILLNNGLLYLARIKFNKKAKPLPKGSPTYMDQIFGESPKGLDPSDDDPLARIMREIDEHAETYSTRSVRFIYRIPDEYKLKFPTEEEFQRSFYPRIYLPTRAERRDPKLWEAAWQHHVDKVLEEADKRIENLHYLEVLPRLSEE